MNTGCFQGWGVYASKKTASAGSNFTPILNTFHSFSYRSGHDIFLNNSELHLVNDLHFEPSSTNVEIDVVLSGHLFDREDSVDFVLKPTTTSAVRFHKMTKKIQKNRPFKLNVFNLDFVLDLKKGALIGKKYVLI